MIERAPLIVLKGIQSGGLQPESGFHKAHVRALPVALHTGNRHDLGEHEYIGLLLRDAAGPDGDMQAVKDVRHALSPLRTAIERCHGMLPEQGTVIAAGEEGVRILTAAAQHGGQAFECKRGGKRIEPVVQETAADIGRIDFLHNPGQADKGGGGREHSPVGAGGGTAQHKLFPGHGHGLIDPLLLPGRLIHDGQTKVRVRS